jgi:hypothetical protein
MRTEPFKNKTAPRIPMARGEGSNGEVFVMSLLTDGSGLVLEFKDEESYFLPTQELVAEILKTRTK